MKTRILLLASLWGSIAMAADYTLDFSGATLQEAEAPVLRRAEMAVAVGSVPAVAVGDMLNLKLFGDVDFALRIVSAPPAGIAGQSFIARDEKGSASAIVKVSKESARISVDDFMNRRQFTVRCKDGKVLIVERDNSQADDGECGTCASPIETPEVTTEAPITLKSAAKSRTLLGASGNNEFPVSEQKSVVDILVAFDQGAKAWAEKTWTEGETIEEFADYAVNKMNTVLANSQLDDKFCYRLVGVVEIDGSWTTINDDLLEKLRTGQGALGRMPALRDRYGADIVTLLVDIDESATRITTGISRGLRTPTAPADTEEIPASAISSHNFNQYGINICHIRRVESRYTMSHEVGHNMGCGHSDRQGDSKGPQSTKFSCGYHFVDTNNGRRYTVMGYNYTADDYYNYDAIPYFSTPDITPEEYGVPLGDDTHDNRRVLLQSHKGVSAWREHVVPYEWDVRFLDESGKELRNGRIFENSIKVTLGVDSQYSEAKIYLTQDGSTPNAQSLPYNPYATITVNDTTTLTASIVTNGVALSSRSITLVKGTMPTFPGSDGLVWETSGKYPWKTESIKDWTNATVSVLHNYDFKDNATADSTSYLSTEIEGPKRLYFHHASLFPSQNEYFLRFSRFSIVCEGGDAFTIANNSMTWHRNHIDIPDGKHQVTILYNHLNNYGTLASQGVWLDDLQLADNQTEVSLSPRDVTSFDGTLQVTLAADKDGQTIYYTTDGSEPTTASSIYEGSIAITANCTIKAMAVDDAGNKSAVFSSNYRTKTQDASGGINIGERLGDKSRVWSCSPQFWWGKSGNYTCNTAFKNGVDRNHSWLGTIAEGPAVMSFTYKTRFDTGSKFSVTIDGEESMVDETGSSDEISRSVSIPSGLHDVRFVYSQFFPAYSTSVAQNYLFLKSVSFVDSAPLTWSGEAEQNGNGRWMDDSAVLSWNDSANAFENSLSPSVTFGDLSGNTSPTVTVKGAVVPGVVAFDATTTSYTFAKGDDEAIVTLPDANFQPTGNVTFNIPVRLEADSFRVADGKTYTFNAPFGPGATSSSATFAPSTPIVIGNNSTLTVAPGEGNTQTFATFNNASDFYSSAKFNVGAGTVVFTNDGNGKGLFGSLQVTANGGKLVFNGKDALAGQKSSNVNVENYGEIVFGGMENFQRKLNFKGGKVTVAGDLSYGRAFELNSAPAITVSANSIFDSNSSHTSTPYVFLRAGTPTFTFSNNATLVNNIIYADGTSNFFDANGGITLSGTGTFVQNSFGGEKLTYLGETKVNGGMTLELNAEHVNAGAYTVESGARLSGSGAITGDGVVTLNGSSAKLCGSLTVNKLACANGAQFGDQWNPVAAVVTGSLATKLNGASVTVTNGGLTIGAGCDTSDFATANLDIRDAGLVLSNSLTVASLNANNSTITLANNALLTITGSASVDCSKLKIILENLDEAGGVMMSAAGGFANINKLEGLPAGYTAALGDTTTQLRYEYDPNYVEYQTRRPVVDVLVAFDEGAQAYMGERSLEEFAQTQIDKMNEALVTNRLNTCYTYRLAGVCKVDAAYDNINDTVTLIQGGAGPCVTLRTAREVTGADTVTLLIKTTGSVLGHSSQPDYRGDMALRHDDCFSVCSIEAVDTGKQHTMLHENAHNMGCGHARAQYTAADLAQDPNKYSYGYYFNDGSKTRHTIMAYGTDDNASWYFSTSSDEFGFTLGDATNDNARVLRETCGKVSQWREAVKPYEDEVVITDANGNEIQSGRVFSDSLTVKFTAPVDGAKLYITYDGSEPVKDAEKTWEQESPYTVTYKGDRNIKVAYLVDHVMSPVRTIRFYKRDIIPSDVPWQTSVMYPWEVEGDTIRSYNQTDYTYQCTTPLKATIVGPKVLKFKHKSYFGGESVAGNNYSHFDVLLDDSPVLTQTECTNSWTDAFVGIPEGTHEVTFVFSQRFAMNNSKDYKDGEPEADDAVWLKDIALSDLHTVECAHSSTSDDVEWVFPYDFEATAIDGNLDGIEVGSKGVVETLNFSTNAVVLSVLAELPENGEGALMGLVDVSSSSKYPIFAYANGDGMFTLYYYDGSGKATTSQSKTSKALDVAGLHVWTLAYVYNGGGYLYCDGELVASDPGIKWTNTHRPAECLTFGSAYTNAYPLVGAKIYSVHSDFGNDAFVSVTNKPASAVSDMLKTVPRGNEFVDETLETQLALLNVYKELGYIPDKNNKANSCVLRISEIMPKPTDAQDHGALEGMDVNGLESGWVEIENTSDQWADLKDYKFIRSNRGKKTGQADFDNFPSVLIPPKSRFVFYTSERYSNSADMTVSAWATPDEGGVKPKIYTDLGNILVWPDKVNPKKSPFVRLIYTPSDTIVDTVIIPSDVPEGWSIIIGETVDGEATKRWLCPTPTRGEANTDTSALTKIGPNVGPLYELTTGKKHDSASEFARPVPPAQPGEDYEITFSLNPVMSPTEAGGFRDEDAIDSITLVYRTDLTNETHEVSVDKSTESNDEKDCGHTYKAYIPADALPAAGHLVQWKFNITDASGNKWTSPSFNNKDDGYEWYGTIVEPDPETQMSENLPTWHMFASGHHLTQMDVDKDKQNLDLVPNYARIAIYDSSTSNYYDYVRIDLRGNTSAGFTKKGHGLRFAKAHPLTMTDIVTGETIEEIRKTSLISEYADPSYMRQMIAFWLWRKMGNKVPFDFPVRCNLNGEFYQLAFNSERFTDELIEDVYGLDKFGYGYKNVGTLKSGTGTTAGKIEKKTPDDEDESNITVLQNELRAKITAAQSVEGTTDAAKSSTTTDEKGLDNTDLTKFVVQKFNLPAWLNYLASARITQEMDDVWANVCAYYDNAEMKEGVRGTDTWMPLGYDFNLSFGQWHYNDLGGTRFGLMSNQDWFKSHPFYGGNRVRCWKQEGMTGTCNNGNDGFEAVWQSAKFRRLYLRRLRTLMDQELKEPGTAEEDTPFMAKMREMADLMRADAADDADKWGNDNSDSAIDVWTTRPANMDAGIDDIWENYVVPRRQHLYVTHSVTNTAKTIGYGSNLNAGIPEVQSPIAELKDQISVTNLSTEDGYFHDTDVVVIYNGNDEVVDMSGWKLAFSADFTFPAGTVCDANDYIYIVADRRQYIEDHAATLTDEVIVGNATITGTGPIVLSDADGEEVFRLVPETNELNYLRLHSFCGNTNDGADGDTGEWFVLTNISDTVTLDLAGVTVCFLKQGDPEDGTAHCHVTLENKKGKGNINPLKSWRADQADYADKGWTKIQNNKQQITIWDKYGTVCQSLKVTQKNFALAYGDGGYLVCDSTASEVKKDSNWHQELAGLPNNGEESKPFEADSQEAANAIIASAEVVLSEEDEAVGLAQYLKIVAEPVEGEIDKYKAVIVLNPEKEPELKPVIAEPTPEDAKPVEFEEDEGGNKTVKAAVSNAVIGLWYGYEVANTLGPGENFQNDVGSFERATEKTHTVTGSPRDKSETSAFFRVKVLPAKPPQP